MAKTKPLDSQKEADRYEKLIIEATTKNKILYAKKRDFARPDLGKLPNILGQRQTQRKWLFIYALSFSTLSFIGLACMLFAQSVYKVKYHDELFGKLELGSVAIGVFLQFLALLKIITDSLWNDKPYLDAGALMDKKK